MEHVRARAGVGKATLYRRYGSKEELVAAAVRHLNAGDRRRPTPARCASDFAAIAESALAAPPSDRSAAMFMPRLLAESAGDPELHAIFYRQPRAAAPATMRETCSSARVDRGELRDDVDLELAIDMLVGPIIYRC